MPEPFIKFYYEWMPALGLTGNEAIVFSFIHGYTEWQGGYPGGTKPLESITGLARSGVYRILDKLIQREYIALVSTKKGRFHSTYKSLLDRPMDGTVQETNRPMDGTQPSHGWDSNRPTGGTLLDNNRYIDNPPTPLRGGSANNRSHRPRCRRGRGREVFTEGSYSEERLRAEGVIVDFRDDNLIEDVMSEMRLQ